MAKAEAAPEHEATTQLSSSDSVHRQNSRNRQIQRHLDPLRDPAPIHPGPSPRGDPVRHPRLLPRQPHGATWLMKSRGSARFVVKREHDQLLMDERWHACINPHFPLDPLAVTSLKRHWYRHEECVKRKFSWRISTSVNACCIYDHITATRHLSAMKSSIWRRCTGFLRTHAWATPWHTFPALVPCNIVPICKKSLTPPGQELEHVHLQFQMRHPGSGSGKWTEPADLPERLRHPRHVEEWEEKQTQHLALSSAQQGKGQWWTMQLRQVTYFSHKDGRLELWRRLQVRDAERYHSDPTLLLVRVALMGMTRIPVTTTHPTLLVARQTGV